MSDTTMPHDDDPFRHLAGAVDAMESTPLPLTEWIEDELLLEDLPPAADASRSAWAFEAQHKGISPEIALVPLSRVDDPRELPFRIIPYVTLLGRDDHWYKGSAFVIGPHHLATAGHNVFMRDVGGPRAVRVYPGRKGGGALARLEAVQWKASIAWEETGDTTRDYGVIRVAEDLTKLGQFTMVDVPLNAPPVNVAGYPSGDPNGDMWGARAPADKVSNRRIGYSIATEHGQSGGAVWLPGTRDAVGIHIRFREHAIAIRLTPEVRSALTQLA